MSYQPKFIVLNGDGINCENETARAFENAGAKADIVHINVLLKKPALLKDYDGMGIPGGFSFGDELGSGQILAIKIRHGLGKEFLDFVNAKKPIIGICNGFQVLVKLGLLPYPNADRAMTLAQNINGSFIDRWAELDVPENTVCKWTTGLDKEKVELPVRHGEGRVILNLDKAEEVYQDLVDNGQIPFYYKDDFNGSYSKIAGVCDPEGLILGLMPHPEAFVNYVTYRKSTDDVFKKGVGQYLFDNIVKYIVSEKSNVGETK